MATTRMTVDPENRKWKPITVNDKDNDSSLANANNNNKSPSSGGSDSGGGSFSLPAPSTDPKSAAGKAQNEQNKKAYYALEGDLAYLPSKKTIKLRAGDTVRLKGIGTYLSGNYYVAEVVRTIDASSGYSQKAKLYKPNFRKFLKIRKKKKKKNAKGVSEA